MLYGSLFWGGADGSDAYSLWERWVWVGKQEKQEKHIWLAKAKCQPLIFFSIFCVRRLQGGQT